MNRGWVYVLDNPSMPGKVKIGFTERIPDQRANELDVTGVPTPYVLQFTALVDKAFELEQAVHASLDDNRVRQNREWFDLSVDEAINAVRSTAEKLGLMLLFEDDRFPDERDLDELDTIEGVDWSLDSPETIDAHKFLQNLRNNNLPRCIKLLESTLNSPSQYANEVFNSICDDGFAFIQEVINKEDGSFLGIEVRLANLKLLEDAYRMKAIENLAQNKKAEEQIFKLLYEHYLSRVTEIEGRISAIKFFWNIFPKRRVTVIQLIDGYTNEIFSYDLSKRNIVWTLGNYSMILVERNQIDKAIDLVKHIVPSIVKMKYQEPRISRGVDDPFWCSGPMGGIVVPLGAILGNSSTMKQLDLIIQQLIQIPMFVNCLVKCGFPQKYQYLEHRALDEIGIRKAREEDRFIPYKDMYRVAEFRPDTFLLPTDIDQIKEFLISLANKTQWKCLSSLNECHKLSEDDIYEQVAEELVANNIKQGLWTKAYSLANGDEKVIKAEYIKLRVDQLTRNGVGH